MATERIIVQNIVMILGIKVLVMVLGILGLAGMWAAVMADVGVCLLAVGNSMRIFRINPAGEEIKAVSCPFRRDFGRHGNLRAV
ncbi:hypothetical protein [Akkermansia sp.]|uniref:hypothetical protein n=1 Tax=Akkermansia sp. TaxID=1872421 RepID=UPI003992DBF9